MHKTDSRSPLNSAPARRLAVLVALALLGGCAAVPTGRIIAASPCNDRYAGSIADPIVFPRRTIRVDTGSSVTLETPGEQEDRVVVEIDGKRYTDTIPLLAGKHDADFLVDGEGEVHYWHGVIKVGPRVVFEHRQRRLPAEVCEGEIYRYRLHFDVKP